MPTLDTHADLIEHCSEQYFATVAAAAGLSCRPSATGGRGWCVVRGDAKGTLADVGPRVMDCRLLVGSAPAGGEPIVCGRLEVTHTGCGVRHAPVLLVGVIWSRSPVVGEDFAAKLYWAKPGADAPVLGTCSQVTFDANNGLNAQALQRLLVEVATKGAVPDALP